MYCLRYFLIWLADHSFDSCQGTCMMYAPVAYHFPCFYNNLRLRTKYPNSVFVCSSGPPSVALNIFRNSFAISPSYLFIIICWTLKINNWNLLVQSCLESWFAVVKFSILLFAHKLSYHLGTGDSILWFISQYKISQWFPCAFGCQVNWAFAPSSRVVYGIIKCFFSCSNHDSWTLLCLW